METNYWKDSVIAVRWRQIPTALLW